MDKYIIDGVEYSYGEKVEVSDDKESWVNDAFIEYDSGHDLPIMCIVTRWKYIRKIQHTQSLSGQKAKLILDDGTEMNVTIE